MPVRGLFVGLSTLDLVWRVEGYPRANTKNVVEERGVFAGGPAANAAVVFAALGGRARLYTAIGRHPFAAVIRDDLEAQGVEVIDAAPDHAEPPAMASILVSDPGGDRTVVSSAGAGLPAIEFAPKALGDPQAVLLDGHLLSAAVPAAKLARERGVPTILDGGSWKPSLPDLLPWIDYAVCSEHFEGPTAISEYGVEYRAITHGERPIRWETDHGSGELPVPQVEAIDTLAAGDFFHGAFAFAIARGEQDFVEALRFAARIAARSCESFGTRTWLSALKNEA